MRNRWLRGAEGVSRRSALKMILGVLQAGEDDNGKVPVPGIGPCGCDVEVTRSEGHDGFTYRTDVYVIGEEFPLAFRMWGFPSAMAWTADPQPEGAPGASCFCNPGGLAWGTRGKGSDGKDFVFGDPGSMLDNTPRPDQVKRWVAFETRATVSPRAERLRMTINASHKPEKAKWYFDDVTVRLAE